jgi:hypothetical protein
METGIVEQRVVRKESSARVGLAVYVAASYPYFLRSAAFLGPVGSMSFGFANEFPARMNRDILEARF